MKNIIDRMIERWYVIINKRNIKGGNILKNKMKLKKSILLLFIILGLIGVICAVKWKISNDEHAIRAIYFWNADKIGKEVNVVGSEVKIDSMIENSEYDVSGKSYVGVIKVKNGKTPALTADNGVIGVFTDNGKGWNLNAGDMLSLSFEKYPMDNGQKQTIMIGCMKDGKMEKGEIYREEMTGTYQFDCIEKGEYNLYFINLSSDPVSLKEGRVEVQVN